MSKISALQQKHGARFGKTWKFPVPEIDRHQPVGQMQTLASCCYVIAVVVLPEENNT